MKIFLCFLLVGLAFGRDYCSAGKLCNADWQCKQEFGTGFSSPYGYCCSGRCTAMPLYLPRGSFCNNTDFCVGQCSSGDSCINNTCVGAMVTPGCNCSTSADCKTPTLDGYTISTSCVNGMCTMKLPRDAACTSDSQCASDSCYQGTCLGENLEYGDSCRLSSECAPYQCLNGKCAFQTEGMTCNVLFSTCDYSKFFCNATTSKCQAFVPLGGYCNGAGQCVSSAYCNTTNGFTYPGPCVARVGEGAACDSLLMPCSSGLSCMNYNYGVKKCVKYHSIPDHGYCTSTIQCKNGDATCAREGANTTANFCVPDHSIKAGGNCSYDVSCPEYASCTGISTPLTCTESYLGKQCDSNSTSSDSSQCDTLDCACNNKCEVPSSEISCGQWEVAEGDPTKMNDADRKMTANAACCGLCFGGSEFSYKTTLTGFQIDCKKLTFTMMPACNTTSGGAPLLLNCDDWNGVSIGATANLSALFLLIASLVAYFQEM